MPALKTMLVSEIFPPRTGGSGRWFYEIYLRLPREDYLIAAGRQPGDVEFDRQHDLHLTRVPLTMSAWGIRSLAGLRGYWAGYNAVRRLARQHHVDRLHCGRMLPEGWIAWLLKRRHGIPYWCYVHGEETNYGILSRELGWMMRRVVAGADLLVANSENTANILRTKWDVPPAKIRVLHPGVDVERFVPAEPDPTVRERLGWGSRPVVLTVGRLQIRKGHDQLIRALPAIRQPIPDVLYAIVGAGEERPRLETLVAELGLSESVCFHGELEEAALVECYQQCDLFVLPNREVQGDIEGFGMVLLEAQACGKPVIAGQSGGTAETMDVGRTGSIVPCEGPEPLAAAIAGLLKDHAKRMEMGEAGRHWVVGKFSWEALSRQAEQLFSGPSNDARSSARNSHSAVYSGVASRD